MGAQDAAELVRLLRPASVVPLHYEGWPHFRRGRETLVMVLGDTPDVDEKIRRATLGEPLDLTVQRV